MTFTDIDMEPTLPYEGERKERKIKKERKKGEKMVEPPIASVDADFELAMRLQEEENRRASQFQRYVVYPRGTPFTRESTLNDGDELRYEPPSQPDSNELLEANDRD